MEETKTELIALDSAIDKIDAALPAVRDLDASDAEMDDLASKATEMFENVSDLAFNVDSRFSAELLQVAKGLLDTAVTAKTAKLNKKLKMIDLQLKKLKIDQEAAKATSKEEAEVMQAEGHLLSRNDLLEMIAGNREFKDGSNTEN